VGLCVATCVCLFQVQFEQSLQSVNPRVCVPYWDYSIDVTALEASGGDLAAFYESEVFGENFFGSTSGGDDGGDGEDDLAGSGAVNPAGRVVTGRFQRTPVSIEYWGVGAAGDTVRVLNGYGLVRSPWNMNNDPFVNRFNNTYGFPAISAPAGRRRRRRMMSGVGQGGGGSGRKLSHAAVQGSVTTTFGLCDCETLYDVMQFNDWFDFGLQVQYFPHGPIHKLVGGVGGADYKTFMAANTANNVDLDLVSKWALLAEGTFKEMWRSGDVTCPTSCSSDAAPTSALH